MKSGNESCADLRKGVPSEGNREGECLEVGTCLGYRRKSRVGKGESQRLPRRPFHAGHVSSWDFSVSASAAVRGF